MNELALALRQVRYQNRAFWRNPAAAFFTIIFPLIFLVLFNLIFSDDELPVRGATRTSAFYVPAIAALSVINGSYTGLATSLLVARDNGLLKRTRGTPLPAWAFLFGRIAHMNLMTLLVVVIVTAAGALFYDVDVPTTTLPAFALALVVGTTTFASLAFAITSFIPNVNAGGPILNVTTFPLMFISDVFLPSDDMPDWLGAVGEFFPLKHLSLALQTAFNPFETGAGFELAHIAVVAVWGAAGLLVAARYFTWEPRL